MCPAESFSRAYIRTRLLLEKDDKGDGKHVVGVEIMTPGRIVLAPKGAGGGVGVLEVNPDANLTVYADEIVISGTLQLPGRSVMLFARRLISAEGAGIFVDGAKGAEPKEALKAGAPSAKFPHKKKVAVGETGERGRANCTWHTPAPGQIDEPGHQGQNADEAPDEMNGEDGEEGAPGGNGGTICIVCGRLEKPYPMLSAIGGRGGQGQQGQAGAKGGRGGKGDDARDTSGFGLGWSWRVATGGGNGGRGGKGGKGGRGGPGGRGGKIAVRATKFGGIPILHFSMFERMPLDRYAFPGESGRPGAGGPGGDPGDGGDPHVKLADHLAKEGGPRPNFWGGPLDSDDAFWAHWRLLKYGGPQGGPGSPGREGDECDKYGAFGTEIEWDVPKLKNTLADIASFASLDHLRLYIDALWLEAAVSIDSPADLASDNPAAMLLTERLTWLLGLVGELSHRLPDDSPDKRRVASLYSATFNLISNLSLGRNAFGKRLDFVPVVSLNSRHSELLNAIKNLEDIEKPANEYLDKVAAAQDARATLDLTYRNVDAIAGYLDGEAASAKKDLEDIGFRLAAADDARKARREAVEPLKKDVAEQIRAAFTVDWDLFFNALSQLAFTETKSGPKAALMVAGQAGSVVHDAATKILSDTGDKFDKRFLLNELKSFDADRIGAELTSNTQSFKDDSSSYRYLTDIVKFRQRISEFVENPKIPSAQKLKAGLTALIDAVDRRNRLVDEYNDCVRRIIELRTAATSMRDEKHRLDSTASTLADPSESAVVTYVTGLLDRAKSEALRQLYMFYRAYVLWAFDAEKSLAECVGIQKKNRSAEALAMEFATVSVTSSSIKGAKDTIERWISEALEKTRPTPVAFPSNPEPFKDSDGKKWLATGALVTLDRNRHPGIFQALEDYDEVEFELLPATRTAINPGAVGTPTGSIDSGVAPYEDPVVGLIFSAPLYDWALRLTVLSREGNPFFDMANVRLTKVRVFLDETGAKGLRKIYLLHTGDERFVRRQGTIFPAEGYVTHDEVDRSFAYNSDDFRFDPRYGFAAELLQGPQTEDGDLQPKKGTDEVPWDTTYAPIGPFARWRLQVPTERNANPGLHWENVKRIFIDFHGSHQNFRR